MNSGNGWIKYLVGVIVTLVLFVAIPTMASHMITNDKESRARDAKIDEKYDKKVTALRDDVYHEIKETRKEVQTIQMSMVEIKTILEQKL